MSDLTHTVVEYSTKETAAALRKALRETFPGVKFSVRMARGTAYGLFDVAWTDGPTVVAVDRVCGPFRSERFNGMTDSYDRVEPTLYAAEDGTLHEPRWSCCGILTQRRYSDDAEAWASCHAVEGSRWWNDRDAPQMFDPGYYARHDLLAGVDLSSGFPERPAQVWRDRFSR